MSSLFGDNLNIYISYLKEKPQICQTGVLYIPVWLIYCLTTLGKTLWCGLQSNTSESPSNTMYSLTEAYLRTKWHLAPSIQPFGHNRQSTYGPKSGGLLCPFPWGN